MIHGPGRNPADRSLQDARRALARMAPIVRYGSLVLGLAVALDRVWPLVADGQYTWGERRVIGAVTLVILGGFAAAGWAAGRILEAAAGLIGAVAEGSEAAVRMGQIIETRLVPGLERAVAAIEAQGAGGGIAPPPPEVDAVRRAIAEGRWGRAERLLDAFARDHTQSPHIAALTAALTAARDAESATLRAKLDAAIDNEDAATAITCRDALTRHLGGDELGELDLRVVRWIVRWVRLRSRGEVSPEVASVASLAADRFGDTDEGRSLLAAVPSLRRRAGLCPDCARPYRGPAGACPDCAGEHPPRPARGGARPKGVS